MPKTDMFEHEARTLATGYQKRVNELLAIGYPVPEERKQAAKQFAVAIGAIDAPPLSPENGSTASNAIASRS